MDWHYEEYYKKLAKKVVVMDEARCTLGSVQNVTKNSQDTGDTIS